jgi:hypothetical protein
VTIGGTFQLEGFSAASLTDDTLARLVTIIAGVTGVDEDFILITGVEEGTSRSRTLLAVAAVIRFEIRVPPDEGDALLTAMSDAAGIQNAILSSDGASVHFAGFTQLLSQEMPAQVQDGEDEDEDDGDEDEDDEDGGVTSSCFDGTKNGDETDTDCGGSCDGCANGLSCAGDSDCNSAYSCSSGNTCEAADTPTCTDDEKNGDETDVDCGGTCSACSAGHACYDDGDCVGSCCSGECVDGSVCPEQGGPGDVCAAGAECTSGNCCPDSDGVNSYCSEVNTDCSSGGGTGAHDDDHGDLNGCDNSVKDNAETDVDCGGETCSACAAGNACYNDGDCVGSCCSDECVDGGVCPSDPVGSLGPGSDCTAGAECTSGNCCLDPDGVDSYCSEVNTDCSSGGGTGTHDYHSGDFDATIHIYCENEGDYCDCKSDCDGDGDHGNLCACQDAMYGVGDNLCCAAEHGQDEDPFEHGQDEDPFMRHLLADGPGFWWVMESAVSQLHVGKGKKVSTLTLPTGTRRRDRKGRVLIAGEATEIELDFFINPSLEYVSPATLYVSKSGGTDDISIGLLDFPTISGGGFQSLEIKIDGAVVPLSSFVQNQRQTILTAVLPRVREPVVLHGSIRSVLYDYIPVIDFTLTYKNRQPELTSIFPRQASSNVPLADALTVEMVLLFAAPVDTNDLNAVLISSGYG